MSLLRQDFAGGLDLLGRVSRESTLLTHASDALVIREMWRTSQKVSSSDSTSRLSLGLLAFNPMYPLYLSPVFSLMLT